MNKRPSYRPDIDGLRAVAVLLVVAFHAFPTLLAGGYVGVDIFFVISGFLITGLLLEDLEKKEFSFSGFYGRRIRRIFPALIPVLVVSLAAGWILLLPWEYASLGLNIFGGAAFSSNLVLLGETSYFDLAATQKPLLHLWSLGIEEQFYIVWPLLLLLAFSRRLSIAILAVGLLLVSFVWNVRSIGSAADFYLPFTRAWELMIGGFVAAIVRQGDRLRLDRALTLIESTLARALPAGISTITSRQDWRALLGISFLIGAVIAGAKNTGAFPGWFALLPTIGAALLISADGAWINRNILSNSSVVLVGLISYPLYLWHWPLLSLTKMVAPQSSWQARLVVIAGATALAWMTYQWIERPFRTGNHPSHKIALLCVAMAFVGNAGLATFQWHGVASRIPAPIREISYIHADPEFEIANWRYHTCFLDPGESRFTPDCRQHGTRPLLFLWGDSIAASLYPGLKQLQSSIDFELAQYTKGGCPPSLRVRELPDCGANNDYVFSLLADVRPDIVLLESLWGFDPLPGLRDLIARLRLLKIPRIVIMGPPATWTIGLPSAAFRYYMIHSYLNDPARQMIPLRSNFGVDETQYAYQQYFRNQVQSWGVEYISAWDAMCDGDECVTRVGDRASDVVVFDNAHLTLAGSTYMARSIASCLFPDRPDQIAYPISGRIDRSLVCRPPGEKSVVSPAPKVH